MGLFGNNQTVTTTFAGKDQLSPVVRGIRATMDRFKRDAATGFGVGAGISVFNTATRAVGMLTDALGDAVNAAIEDERSQAQLTQTLKANIRGWDGNTDAIDKTIDSRIRLGFADDDLRESLGKLVVRTNDSNEALRLQALAMDLARGRNISLASATELVGKAYSGQIGALRRAGIAIDANATSTQALMRLQRAFAGQAEAFANTTEGAILSLQLELGELSEDIGKELLPVVRDLAVGIRDNVVPAVKELMNVLKQAGPALDLFMGLLTGGPGAAFATGIKAFEQWNQAGKTGLEWLNTLTRTLSYTAGRQAVFNENSKALSDTFKTLAEERFKKAQEEARRLAEALGFVAQNTRRAKNRGDDLDKTWKRLIQRGDGNRRSVRELTQDINMWERRFRRAIRNNDTEAAAFARVQAERAREERRQRRLVIAQYGRERESINKTKDKVTDLRREMEKVNTLPDAYWRVNIDVAMQNASQIPVFGGIVNFIRNRRRDGRASGGPVSAGGVYTVGERGPETLVMGNRGGHIIPNGGDRDINLYVDGEKLFRWMMRRQGREALRSPTG